MRETTLTTELSPFLQNSEKFSAGKLIIRDIFSFFNLNILQFIRVYKKEIMQVKCKIMRNYVSA